MPNRNVMPIPGDMNDEDRPRVRSVRLTREEIDKAAHHLSARIIPLRVRRAMVAAIATEWGLEAERE